MNALGRFGEDYVARWLQESGCTVLERGWRFGHGEIDLVILDGEDLAFVEVKTRTNLDMALPREYVTPQKQNKLRKTARMYLAEKRLDCPARFDVAEVYAEHGFDEARIEYLENAFQ